MESVQTPQDTSTEEQGQVSAPATEPKDKQEPTTNTAAPNTFTEKEKDIAARHKFEPKLVRLLNEIVEEQLQLINENLDERLVAPEETEAESEQEEESQEGDKSKPTTGIPQLDKLIDGAMYVSQAMAYTCLDLCQQDASLGDRITTVLHSALVPIRDGGVPEGADFECDVAPATKWLRFSNGFEAGVITRQAVNQTASTETEQVETAKEETQATDQPEEDIETQEEPEKESYGFNPKERVKAYEVFEQYMNTRTLEEKQAAVALSMLLSKQQYLPDEQIGDRLYKQWRDEVLAIGSLDQLQLKGVPGNEAFCQGYLTAMIVMDG